MRIKFNKFERVAGLFVVTAIVGGIAATVAVAVKRGWFETKIPFTTQFPSADGIHIGTVVQMAGLRAGSVDSVELGVSNEIRVRFSISEKFHDKIREDSILRITRPFVIGEKVIDIEVGSNGKARVLAGAMLPSEESVDLMDMLNGRKLGPAITALSKMMDNLKFVADAFLDPERSKNIVRIFDELAPLIKNMSGMGREVTSLLTSLNKKQQLQTVLTNLVDLTTVMNKLVPVIQAEAPQLAQDFKAISHNVVVLTTEMQKMLPMLATMAPEFPRASRRAMEALDETVVVLKALQKSFILRSNAKEVREEEAKRQPASDKQIEPK